MLSVLAEYEATRSLPLGVQTAAASGAAACWRMLLLPLDAAKTMMQVCLRGVVLRIGLLLFFTWVVAHPLWQSVLHSSQPKHASLHRPLCHSCWRRWRARVGCSTCGTKCAWEALGCSTMALLLPWQPALWGTTPGSPR